MTTTEDEVPHVIHEGTISIVGETFTVCQLSDGRRVFPEEDFKRLLTLLGVSPAPEAADGI